MMYFADNARDPNFAKDPAVVRFHGRYLLYYSVGPYPEGHPKGSSWHTAVAESNDLVHWRHLMDIEIDSPVPEYAQAVAPAARVIDGKVYLFYQSRCKELEKSCIMPNAICLAVSEDGLHFKAEPSNPVFHPPISSWSCGRAIDADLIFFKGQYFLYTATRDPSFRIQKVAVAVSGGDFSAKGWTLAYDESILQPELPWEQECIEAPATLIHNDKVYMFYGGAYNNKPQQIGCAVSRDGIHFERISPEPLLPCGKEGEWNSSESGHPYAFTDDDGEQYLFFQGNNDNGKTWYLSVKKILWDGDMPILQDMP